MPFESNPLLCKVYNLIKSMYYDEDIVVRCGLSRESSKKIVVYDMRGA